MLNRRPPVTKPAPTSHWDILKGRGGENICCVCRKKLNTNKIFIGKHMETDESLWRHSSCGGGSDNWKKIFNGYVDKDINKILKGDQNGRKS
jgi:hypothetical protein